jgi:hypothetical protein
MNCARAVAQRRVERIGELASQAVMAAGAAARHVQAAVDELPALGLPLLPIEELVHIVQMAKSMGHGVTRGERWDGATV